MQSFEKFIKEIILTTVLLIAETIYAVKLSVLNNELLNLELLQILGYRTGIIWKYFLIFIFVMMLASYSIYKIFSARNEIETGTDFIVIIILITLILLMACIIIYLIQNPILRAIALAITLASIGIGVK